MEDGGKVVDIFRTPATRKTRREQPERRRNINKKLFQATRNEILAYMTWTKKRLSNLKIATIIVVTPSRFKRLKWPLWPHNQMETDTIFKSSFPK
jgi:hypothetical protein